MSINKEDQIQMISEKFTLINRALIAQCKLKYPSPHTLENSALEIMETLRNITIDEKEFNIWRGYQLQYLDIFLADLEGELGHDYDQRLVRYFQKWTKEKLKIEKVISDFRQKFRSEI